MDRSLPQQVIRKRRLKLILRVAVLVLILLVLAFFAKSFTLTGVNLNNVTVSEVEEGDLLVTFAATGKVVPFYEEALISPMGSRIMRVMCHPGEMVEEGQPLLEIDTDGQQFEYARLKAEFEQTQNNDKKLRLEIRRKEEAAYLAHKLLERKTEALHIEYEHEQYLLSIGGSSRDRVANVFMELSTAELELENSIKQLEYSRELTLLEMESLNIDLRIKETRLKEMENLLDRARLAAPIRGTISFLLDKPGSSVAPGEVVATVSDISSYRIEAVAGDGYTGQLLVGQEVLVRVGRDELTGRVANIAPSVEQGVLNFGILLDEASHPGLRPNMRTNIRVVSQAVENTLMIKVGEFYKGPGKYDMFVLSDGAAYKRNVTLGGTSFTHIEVIKGLSKGEKVITSDMSNFMKVGKIGVKE